MYQNKRIRESARGQQCAFQIPGVCNGNPETTVWAHSNKQRHGKGRGLKAHDIFGAYACSACHEWYDQGPASRDEKDDAFQLAHERSLLKLVTEGVLK